MCGERSRLQMNTLTKTSTAFVCRTSTEPVRTNYFHAAGYEVSSAAGTWVPSDLGRRSAGLASDRTQLEVVTGNLFLFLEPLIQTAVCAYLEHVNNLVDPLQMGVAQPRKKLVLRVSHFVVILYATLFARCCWSLLPLRRGHGRLAGVLLHNLSSNTSPLRHKGGVSTNMFRISAPSAELSAA